MAGYVDAIGFLQLGGFFVSFMTGNSTRLGVGLAGNVQHAAVAATLIASFVAGVAGASILADRSRLPRQTVSLGLVALVLALSALLHAAGWNGFASVGMAFAMGAENTMFQRNGEVSIGVTYMTGTLVKLGQRIAEALTGGRRHAWVPYLMLWVGLVCGVIVGSMVFPVLGMHALWFAVLLAATLAAAGLRRPAAS